MEILDKGDKELKRELPLLAVPREENVLEEELPPITDERGVHVLDMKGC